MSGNEMMMYLAVGTLLRILSEMERARDAPHVLTGIAGSIIMLAGSLSYIAGLLL